MKAIMSAPHRALLHAIRAAVEQDGWFEGWLDPSAGGPSLVLEAFESTPWASLTFSGCQHRLAVRLNGPMDVVERAWDRLETLFVAGDFPLAGHFLADFSIGEREGEIGPDGGMELRVDLEALTIEA